MKLNTYITTEHPEEVIIYARKRNAIVEEIERIVLTNNTTIVGIYNEEKIIINPMDVSCFISNNNKVYAVIKTKEYQIKEKLYKLEEMLDTNFIKINQSCIANIKRIKSFTNSIGGAVMVNFDNGYKDYISRRELKNVKTRMGL